MQAIAPFPIIFGIISIALGLFWLIGAGAEDDGGPSMGLWWIFGAYYVGLRILRALFSDPMSVLPGFGFVAAGAGLIWLGVWML